MLKIKDNRFGIEVEFIGNINRIPSLRGRKVTETAIGLEKTESTRGVINLVIDIKYMSVRDYNKLETLFLTSSTFEVLDTDKGLHYVNYYINSDTLNLDTEEDLKNSTYYYVGEININRR